MNQFISLFCDKFLIFKEVIGIQPKLITNLQQRDSNNGEILTHEQDQSIRT